MDVRMPNVDGVEATRRLAAAGSPARVLILTTFDLDEYVYEALRAGASGFLLKDVQPAQLVDAVRVVAPARRCSRRPSRGACSTASPTSSPGGQAAAGARAADRARAARCSRCWREGLSNAELAERLFLSETTVKTHVSSILRKLDLRDRVQAVVLAYEAGLGATLIPEDEQNRARGGAAPDVRWRHALPPRHRDVRSHEALRRPARGRRRRPAGPARLGVRVPRARTAPARRR